MKKGDISLEVAAHPRLLSAVRGAVRSYVGSFGFPKARIEEVVLGVDEACANSIRHSYGGRPDRSFRITLRSTRDWLEITLRDGGRPAPAAALRPSEREPAPARESLTPGGLGVQLMLKVFDKVEFCPGRTRGNCITMKLRRPEMGKGGGSR